MNTFEKLKKYLQTYEIGEIVYRKDLMKQKLGWHVTIDNYRNHFSNAGYLETVVSGQYKVVKEIPEKLNSRDLRKKAYPHYLNWYEYSGMDKSEWINKVFFKK